MTRKIRRGYWNISWWLEDRLPARCFQCGQWFQRRRLQYETHRVAGLVLLCPACHSELYGAPAPDL